MPPRGPKGYAFNRTRTTYLATNLLIARTHWSRFRGLMATDSSHFPRGVGLWISPSHGIHTEEDLKPWRLAAVRVQAASVLEVPTGTIRESQTALGDQVDISFEERPPHTEAA